MSEGNSYGIFSNLGQTPYFEVPGGPTYYINIAVADSGTPSGGISSVFPISGGQFSISLVYTITVAGSTVMVNAWTFPGPTVVTTLKASAGALTGGYFQDPAIGIVYDCVAAAGVVTSIVDSNNAVYKVQTSGATTTFTANVVVATGVNLAVDNEATPAIYPISANQFVSGTTTFTVNVPVAYQNAAGPIWQMIIALHRAPRRTAIAPRVHG